MKLKLICIAGMLSASICSQAQTTKPVSTSTSASNSTSVSLYGFVRNDINFDTRQNVFVREGQLDLYPKDLDMVNGSDYNKKSQLNILAILTRLGVKISGPDVLKAKTSAVIEGDFFGQSDVNIGLFRLRHGYVKLDWAKSSLTMGQTWYPLFIPECFPGVVNFNTGIPIAPFGWAGQIKYTAKFDDKTSFSLTAYKPREFSVPSVNAAENTNAPSMNASIPELNAHLQYKSEKFMIGVQADYSMLVPYIKYTGTAGTEINNEKVNALTLMAYTKIVTKSISIKAQAMLGQNTNHWVMMGGYFGYKPTATSKETFKAAKTNAVWADIYSNNKKVSPALFLGYSSNQGADENATAAYGRAIGVTGRGIKDLTRIAPRLDIYSGKLKFGSEIEFTTAKYGARDNSGKVNGSVDKITNTRITFSTIFSF